MSSPLEMNTDGLVLNPRIPREQAELFTSAWRRFQQERPESFGEDAVGISTSGSTTGGVGTIVVLSQTALEVSAAAVNRRLHATAEDVWGLVLPLFHVGGFSIPIRARLAGSRVTNFVGAWDPSRFHAWLKDERVTLLSLVPTQVFDLVQARFTAPSSLRAVVVGGGRIEDPLHASARALGWPVLQSYGMTECSSQIATARPEGSGRELETLDHVEVRTDANQKLWIRSKALLGGRIVFDAEAPKLATARFENPVAQDGWFETSDRAQVEAAEREGQIITTLTILGRVGEALKVLGELVDLTRVRMAIEDSIAALTAVETRNTSVPAAGTVSGLRQKTWVVAIPDRRQEHELILVCEDSSAAKKNCDPQGVHTQGLKMASEKVLSDVRQRLAPFEVPTRTVFVSELPRTPLGKVVSSLLTDQVRAALPPR